MFNLFNLKSLALVFSFSLLGLNGFAQKQKVRNATGKSQIKIENNISRNEAKENAIEKAKIDAITTAFGQYIEQKTTTGLESGKVEFRSYGQTKVKGEWIRTIGEPEISYDFRENEEWISCKIKGVIRKATPKADLQVEILSSPDKNCRTDEFVNNQSMYLYIKSPVDGYLSVFLDDGTKAYRLLPYRRMGAKKTVEIKGDKEYILFSRKVENFGVPADQLELFTNKNRESNTIIVVFSENEFQKPLLNNEKTDPDDYIIPRSLSKGSFEKWLGDQRALSQEFLDIDKKILIKRE